MNSPWRFLEEDNISSQCTSGSLQGSQTGEDSQNDFNDEDYLGVETKEDDTSVHQVDGMDIVPYLQYPGPAAHLPERIFTDLSYRPGGFIKVPPASTRDPVSDISNSRHCEETAEILEAFMGPPL